MTKRLMTVFSILTVSACVPLATDVQLPEGATGITRAEVEAAATPTPRPTPTPSPTFVDACVEPEGTEGELCSMSFHNKENVGFSVHNKTRNTLTATMVIDNGGTATWKSFAMGRRAGDYAVSFTVNAGEKLYLGGMTMTPGKVTVGTYKHTISFKDIKLGVRYPDGWDSNGRIKN